MATVAIDWRQGCTDVAKVTGHRDVRAGQRKSGGAVVEGCAEPRGRRVTRRARGRITEHDMVRHEAPQRRGALPLKRVATVAIGGQRAAVVAIHMAQCAGYGRVRTGQREGCSVVIES